MWDLNMTWHYKCWMCIKNFLKSVLKWLTTQDMSIYSIYSRECVLICMFNVCTSATSLQTPLNQKIRMEMSLWCRVKYALSRWVAGWPYGSWDDRSVCRLWWHIETERNQKHLNGSAPHVAQCRSGMPLYGVCMGTDLMPSVPSSTTLQLHMTIN